MIHDDDLDGYPVPVESRPRRGQWMRGGQSLLNAACALACALVLIGLLLPASSTHCGEPARHAQCRNNLKQIQLALSNYHEEYGAYPPAFIADADGHRLHSWRVLILPFMECWADDYRSLYDRYNLAEPWDGPHNIRLLDGMPGVFRCPSDVPAKHGGTSYVAITGPGTIFPCTRSVRRADVKDGLAGTLTVVEATGLPVPWTAPLDLDVGTMSFEIADPARSAIGSPHSEGVGVATGAGRVAFLRQGIPSEVLRAMTTIAGGERIDAEAWLNFR